MSTMPNIKVTAEASSSPGGSRKTGKSTLFTLTESRDGIRPSASGPAAFEVFEQLLAAPPSAHLLQATSPVDGVRAGPADGEGLGRKRISSDSEIIRLARELPEVGKRWARDIAGNAARVAQVRTNWDKDSAGSAAATKVSKNVSKGSRIETELSPLNSSQEMTHPSNISQITVVLTNFEQEIAEEESEATNLICRPSDSEHQAVESFEMLSTNFTNWDKDVVQKYKHSVGDNSAEEIKVTQLSGIWGTNDVNEDKHLLMNCDNDTTAKSSRASDFRRPTLLDEDVTASDSAIADHCARSSNYSFGAEESSSSVNDGSSIDTS